MTRATSVRAAARSAASDVRAEGRGRRPAGSPAAAVTRAAATSSRRTRSAVTGRWRWLRGLWGRSLQVRVAASTLLVTGVVVFIIGVFLVNQISAGVLRSKRAAALAQAAASAETTSRQLAAVSVGDFKGISTALADMAPQTVGGGDTGLYFTSVRSTDRAVQNTLDAQPPVPEALVSEVSQGNLALQYDRVTVPSTGRRVSALIIGQPISVAAGTFELYYIFPLGAERATVALVQRTVLLAGLGVMLLVAVIAALVTRQVVQPMREAARTAERLAAGDLAQRIGVRGNDELALLGRSFNDMAASLQRQIRRLEDLSRLQRRFTSDVSHELRTPLTTVRMAAEVLLARREEFPPDMARSTELLNDELDRFENLLADLLEISRYDAGVANLELDTVDVRAIVARVVATSEVLATAKGIVVEVDEPAEPLTAEVDPRRIERILRNLVANAIDHSEGRPVRLAAFQRGPALVVTVHDHGVGLRPGEAGLVFNRFWRGDPSRSRLTGGTGLGLAISLEDARLHGGWLQAWGERGKGALFRLTVPISPTAVLPATPEPVESPDRPDGDR